ncbi:MAG: hypothetical protein L3J66_01225 [Bacteroidales bacterium]|nr:hypothetical protein [Bacteroidales bacterium]
MNRNQVTICLLAGLIALLSFSCSRRMNKNLSIDDIVIYPAPPDTARIQFLTTISSSLSVTGKRSGLGRFLLGERENLGISRPYGLAIHKGKVYICDTQLNALEILDLDKHSFSYFVPGGRGQLKKPLNCSVGKNGFLYVADAKRRQVVVFDADGKYVNSFGESDNSKPTDVFVKDDKIWVTDYNNHRVDVYSTDTYEKLYSIPDSEPGNGDYLYSPTSIYVSDENVYVVDFGDFKVKVYTHGGEFIRSVGSYGRSIGQFVRPKGIAVDSSENLYVVDAGFENTQIFNKDGQLLMFFGGSYKKSGDMWLPATVTIDYDNLEFFQDFAHESFELKYLIFVTNQYGPDKVNVYGYVEPKK